MKIVDAMRNRYHPFGSDSLLGQMILVLSFLMVLILCAVYTVFDRYYVHEHLENRYYFNQLSMEAVQSTMEDKARHVLDNMDQLFETSSINRLVVSGKQSQDAQVISSALTLKKWAAAEENVLSASLLIRDSGMIIQSNQLVLNWEQYESQEEYRDFYVNGTPMRGAVMQDGHLKLYASFPVQQPMAVLSVILDMDQLYGIVTDSRINASAWPLYIYDKDRQEIFRRYTAYPEFEDTALTVESSTGQYQCYRLAQHPSTMVMKGYSSEFGWYFISCIEEHDILPAGIQVFKSVFPFLLFLLLLIGCVSILLIYRVYFPIFTLTRHIQTLLGKNPEPQRRSGNELAYIQNAIDQESQKRQQLQALVSSSSAEIVEKLISTLIRSPVPVPEDRLEILRGLGSAYASPGKFLLLLYCCQENSLDAGDSFSWTLHGYESRERVLQFWMPRCQVQHIPVDGRIQGALLLYPEQTTISHINKDVKLFETVMGGDSKRTCRIAWGWGSVSCDLEGVRSSWADAEQTLNRNIYYFDKKPVGEQGPESAESSGYLPRFCQCLELLINNDPDGEARFQALCGELLSRSPGEVSTLYPTLFDCAMEKLIALQADTKELRELCEPGSFEPDRCAAAVTSFFDKVSQLLRYSGYKEQYRYVEKAKSYIQAHYANSMLSLDMVSEYLGISSPYLSTLMTRFLSMGFVEYLSRYRLDQAKQLLEMTNISVSEVGLKTGFNSVQNFGRVFKKYNGESPGKYRERNRM